MFAFQGSEFVGFRVSNIGIKGLGFIGFRVYGLRFRV